MHFHQNITKTFDICTIPLYCDILLSSRQEGYANCNISGVKVSNLKDKMNLTGNTLGSVSGLDYTGQGLSEPVNLVTVDTCISPYNTEESSAEDYYTKESSIEEYYTEESS